MSFQLIYNHRLRQRKQGDRSGVLLKSQDIPAWLEDAVLLSCRMTGREDSPLRYTYRAVTVETGDYHILSCSKGSGIHNLILTPDEVAKLRRNANRPTPAGIMLALQATRFWAADAQAPSLHCEEPRLPASSLPEAEFQPTWKQHTGHKNNARAFLTAPFNKACLVIIPTEMDSQTVLQLLHESDWLSSQRGWGRTFTTMAQLGDSFEETARICIPRHMQDSTEVAIWSRLVPKLDLCAPFEFEELHDVKNSTATSTQPPTEGQEGFAEHFYIPYVYQECPDEEMYNILPRSHPLLRWTCYICGLILLGACVHFMVSETADDAGVVTRKAIEAIRADESILQLKELSKAPYSPDSITRTLDKIYAHLNAAPVSVQAADKERILEIIALLKYASSDTTGHADNILRLRECATELKLPPDKLSRLYLHAAIHESSVPDWEAKLTPAEINRWRNLLNTAPDMRHIMQEESFAPYMKRIFHASQHQPPETSQEPQTGTEQPTRQPPLTCIEGSPLPEPFSQALGKAPLLLQHGHWSIIRRYADTVTRTRFSGRLDAAENNLRVEQVAEGRYRIIPQLTTNNEGEVPTLQFDVQEGELRNLQCAGGHPIAASIPLQGGDDTYTPIMLLPRREVKMSPTETVLPPTTEQLPLELGEKDIVLQQGENRHLSVRDNKGYPWTRMLSELPLQQGQAILHLPILTGSNKLSVAQAPQTGDDYCWSYSKLPTSNTTTDFFDCHLLRIYDFSSDLRRSFHAQANTYCMGSKNGNDDFYSLASLYALSLDAEQEEHVAAAAADLLRLLGNPDFANLVDELLANEAELQACMQELTAQKAQQVLSDAGARQRLRKCILASLSEGIRRAYTECRNQELCQSTPISEMELCLQQVHVNEQGELIWEFLLRQTKQP